MAQLSGRRRRKGPKTTRAGGPPRTAVALVLAGTAEGRHAAAGTAVRADRRPPGRRRWTTLRDHLEAEGHPASLLDRYLPEPDVRERHSRLLDADVGAVRAAIGQTDLTGIPVVRALLVLRALRAGSGLV